MVTYLNMLMDTGDTTTCTPITTILAMTGMKTWVTPECLENPEINLRDLVHFRDINHTESKVV